MRETAVESHPLGFSLGFARGFGSFAKCAKKDRAPRRSSLIAKNAMSGTSAQSDGLETQPRLELDDSAPETVAGTTELAGIDDVGR
jgi:hypothetical protein